MQCSIFTLLFDRPFPLFLRHLPGGTIHPIHHSAEGYGVPGARGSGTTDPPSRGLHGGCSHLSMPVRPRPILLPLFSGSYPFPRATALRHTRSWDQHFYGCRWYLPPGRALQDRSFTVDFFRAFDYRGINHPLTIFKFIEKAGMPPCMTRYAADLFHCQQHYILITIQMNFLYFLNMPRLLTFMPELLARTRPIIRFSRFAREFERLPVHPRNHQDIFTFRFLRHHLHQPVIGPVYLVEPNV